MAVSEIPVDVVNPGQVFACLGFAEAAEILLGPTESAFSWKHEDSALFHLYVQGAECPVAKVLSFLESCSVTALVPEHPVTNAWQEEKNSARNILGTTKAEGDEFPYPEPARPAKYPACLLDEAGEYRIVINHWGDKTRRDDVKFWSGMGGLPGVALVHEAINLVKEAAALENRTLVSYASDPFSLSCRQDSSFRLDRRRDYVPLDAGFSPNNHDGRISMLGFPLVELLATIGLTNARPRLHIGEDLASKMVYSYGIIGVSESRWYDVMLMRLALGARVSPIPGLSFRKFRIELGYPAKEEPGSARCIVSVTEEGD